jgi:ubiquinone/menaquinone biosynthesis C-methylase UbiE
VLEAGCGNGWLAARIADVKNTKVTGIDLNRLELMQALIAFEGRRNLYFIFGEMSEIRLKENSFDIIVFASSLQYFSSLNETIGNALRLLSEQGEIHIIDTPFYKESELIAASERTSEYYSCLGFQQMREFYFHHSLKELEPFNWKVMYNPNSVQNAFLRKKYPFHWIRVRK